MQTSNVAISLAPLLFIGMVFIFGVLGTLYWIWMLVDCATKEPSQGNDKIVWILVIALTHWLGALIYFLIRRPQRKQLLGV